MYSESQYLPISKLCCISYILPSVLLKLDTVTQTSSLTVYEMKYYNWILSLHSAIASVTSQATYFARVNALRSLTDRMQDVNDANS